MIFLWCNNATQGHPLSSTLVGLSMGSRAAVSEAQGFSATPCPSGDSSARKPAAAPASAPRATAAPLLCTCSSSFSLLAVGLGLTGCDAGAL